jgi:FkbM family methyltransferase
VVAGWTAVPETERRSTDYRRLRVVEESDDRTRRQFALDPPSEAGPHPVFAGLAYPIYDAPPGWDVNFLGVRTRVEFFSLYEELADFSTTRRVVTVPPVPNEDYFEWVTLMEAAVEARERFTMIELGAGWGRWLANAALAVRQISGLPVTLVGVESEPQHFAWMEQHLDDNGIKPEERKLVRAAVSAKDGYVWVQVGDAARWYGQSIVPGRTPAAAQARFAPLCQFVRRGVARGDGRSLQRVPAVSLTTLLRPLDRVDLIDVDIQGAEADVLEPAAAALDAKVRRLYVGTHDADVEVRLRGLFEGLGWKAIYDFPSNSTSETDWGRIIFEDGAQTWLNPRL